MKIRTATFLLALCLVSSLSFAGEGTDAPLVVSDPYATVQPDQDASTAKVHREKKNKNACPPQQAAQSAVKNQRQEAKQDRAIQTQTYTSPTM